MDCKLNKLFESQKLLNDYVFTKQGIKDSSGSPLSMEYLIKQANTDGKLGPNSDVNKWLGNYLTAMEDESRELRDEILWKRWSKDSLDMQNIRVEIVDRFGKVFFNMVGGGDGTNK